ncbi:MAG: hypothetical protein AAF467_13330 [Actinomycetota bacterium]
MSEPLDDRLRAALTAATDAQRPISLAELHRRAPDVMEAQQTNHVTVLDFDDIRRREPDMNRQKWLLVAAAVAALLVGAVGIGLTQRGTVPEEGATAADNEGSSTVTTKPPDAPSGDNGLAVVEQFIDARNRRAADEVLDLLQPDAPIEEQSHLLTPDDYPALLSLYEHANWTWELTDCDANTVRVQCEYLTESDWSRLIHGKPLPGTMRLTVDDGKISSVQIRVARSWSALVNQRYRGWVLEQDPEAAAVMWPDAGAPAFTPEAVELFDEWTPRLADAVPLDGTE